MEGTLVGGDKKPSGSNCKFEDPLWTFTLLNGYLNHQDLPSDSLAELCTCWLGNQDGGGTSEYLKLLTALFVVMPTHNL